MSVSPLAVRVSRWALRLALPPFEPRPCAAHSRPEVRRARPPRPGTTAARLRALSSARTDSGWTRRAGPAETRRLAAEGSARLLQKPAGRRKTLTGTRRQTNRARQIDFASFGTVMKDAPGFQTQGVLSDAAETAPAPAGAGPPVLAALKITPPCVQPCRACHDAARLLPGPQPPAASAPCILHASPSLRCCLISQARAEGRRQLASLGTVASWSSEITSPHTGTPRRNSCQSLAPLSQAPLWPWMDASATRRPTAG